MGSIKRITVLGSSGSIGRQALDVIRSHPNDMELYGLAVNGSVETLIEQAHAFKPKVVACAAPFDQSRLPQGVRAIVGEDAAEILAGDAAADVVVNGIGGFAALKPLLSALAAGRRVALANKESIVCGKPLVDAALGKAGEIIPVDSEQSAIFQCLKAGKRAQADKLILTASGGPFWRLSIEELAHVTLNDALSHPTWRMGQKITVDSATMFNKGLEVIEAAYLFDMAADDISVLIHPQSIIHSMVSFLDGTVMANMSLPDMRLPIQYAITYPDRAPSVCKPLDLADVAELTFRRADLGRFAALRMAYDALKAGGAYPIAYNGANEAAVQAFCDGCISFMDIERAVDYTLQRMTASAPTELQGVLEADRLARALAANYIDQAKGKRV